MATGISKGFEEWSIHRRVYSEYFIEFDVLGHRIISFELWIIIYLVVIL